MDVHEEDVQPAQWRDRCAGLVATGAGFVDFLTAVDRPAAGELDVVVHLVDLGRRTQHLIRTTVDRDHAELDSLVGILPGVAWHERETHEMFGVYFAGNPDLRPLLTTDDADRPLLRTTPLPARLLSAWPGACEPAERPPGATRAARQRSAPPVPGVPREWLP
ncbi:MAG: NADH-quinone oxidoreductase subunit C [Candidatus Nanopelagicales bacterium]